ncbi:MAG: hypothetical protein HC918_14840 [Oscillatoriales cyanobacterium SM2_1_8]|nr:hypothetical protein [Oscillatoriales cyanobacterium SM2_1_8]
MKNAMPILLGLATLIGVVVVGRWLIREVDYFLSGLYWMIRRYWVVLVVGGLVVAAAASNLAKK